MLQSVGSQQTQLEQLNSNRKRKIKEDISHPCSTKEFGVRWEEEGNI